MATAQELRARLGNRVRYTIDLEGAAASAALAATWACGCRASGRSFGDLSPVPCPTHRAIIERAFRVPPSG